MTDVTRILNAIERGDAKATDELLSLVYEELRLLAAQKLSHESPGQTLQATALVHEAYIRLVGNASHGWDNRGHFFAAAAEAMRRIFNTPEVEGFPCLSNDGLELYFSARNRAGGLGGTDIYVTTRATRNADWEAPVNLGPPVNTASLDMGPCLSLDGLELYFHSKRPRGYGGSDIYVTRRASLNDPWGEPENLGPQVNSPYHDGCAAPSPDGLSLIFADVEWGSPPRPGEYGGNDLWMTRRANLSAPWQPAVNLGPEINTSGHELGDGICPDGVTMLFCRFRSGVFDNWQTPVLPVVDLNSDGEVDAQDMSVLVEHWHTTDPLCDIGPTPLGDGIVDIQDMIVLSKYLKPGFGRIAHWKLDETEGSVAYDSVGSDHADVYGEAVWQPDGGIMAGALAFDGVDDYVAPMCILNPADGPFRVFAWIKGGAPGQVIASQTPIESEFGGAYLAADAADGTLMTEAILPVPLKSDVVITDGEWHHVGLAWDGECRHLYQDETEVAVDSAVLLDLRSTGWLNIGTGMNAKPGSFWSGLIDDVRVYKKGDD